MILDYILFFVGFFLLVYGAKWLVDGSSSLAKGLKIPTLIIGLTIVAFGTSAPEFLVNIIAAIKGTGGIAFGNIIGSNITNILLVLGVIAIIVPITVDNSTIRKEIPFSLLAILALFFVINDVFIDNLSQNLLTRADGFILLCFFGVFMYYIYEITRKNNSALITTAWKIKKRKWFLELGMIFGGMLLLFLGGKWVVDGGIFIASQLGLSDYVIGASLVALGTSLPELVTSIVAIIKKEHSLAVGNIVGSNIFNIFWVLGMTSVISPVVIPKLINIDLIALFIITILLIFFIMFLGRKYTLERKEGIILVALYLLYLAFLFFKG